MSSVLQGSGDITQRLGLLQCADVFLRLSTLCTEHVAATGFSEWLGAGLSANTASALSRVHRTSDRCQSARVELRVTPMYKKILVPVDGSSPSMLGLSEAIKLAKSLGSQLKVVHVVNELVLTAEPTVYMHQVIDALREQGRAVLGNADRLVREHALDPQSALLESIGGRAADLILEQAKEWGADLIVMGTHGRRGLRRLALGSDAELVVRSSPVPVLLIREPAA